MNPQKSSDLTTSTYAPPASAIVLPPSTVNVHLTETDKPKESKIWAPLFALGVFGCMFLLFHLYISTTFHHASLDRGLQKLEENMHAMMEMYASGNLTASRAIDAPVPNSAIHHGNHQTLADRGFLYERKRHRTVKLAKSRMVESPHVKRGGSVLTWFHPGAGACGSHNSDSDFILAISHDIWDGGAHCGETVTITYQGKTVQATVADECMGCDPGHIDCSPGLLHFLAGPGADMVTDATWLFGDAAPPKPKPKPKPTPTTTYQPTTNVQSTSTSTSFSSSSSSIDILSTAVSTSALAYATQDPVTYGDDDEVQNIEAFNVLLVDLGGLIVLGTSAD